MALSQRRVSVRGAVRWRIAAAVVSLMAFAGSGSEVMGNSLIDTMKHDIFVVTPKNFDAQISSHRKNGVAVVVFFKDNKESKVFLDGEYNELAKEVRGMVKVAGLDCGVWVEHCEKEGITEFPTVYIYPPQPFSPQKYEGERVQKKMANAVLRHIPGSHVKTLRQSDKVMVDALLTTNLAVPKVFLFSNREKSPVLFDALANAFHDRMSFAFVSNNETDVVNRFKVKKFPTLMVLKGEITPDKAGDVYTGEMKFGPLHEWLNVRSETFVKGGGYATEDTVEEIKPWLVLKVPEITRASHQDVCFRHKVLCVIFMTMSGAPSDAVMSMLEKMADHHASTVSGRTPKFKFSWIDSAVEKGFTEMVGGDFQPSVVIFNPHKRLRYVKLPNGKSPTEDAINNMIETIVGGDARFTNVKGQKLAAFAAREENVKDEL